MSCFDWKILSWVVKKSSRLSSGSGDAIYSWWSPIEMVSENFETENNSWLNISLETQKVDSNFSISGSYQAPQFPSYHVLYESNPISTVDWIYININISGNNNISITEAASTWVLPRPPPSRCITQKKSAKRPIGRFMIHRYFWNHRMTGRKRKPIHEKTNQASEKQSV